LEQSQAIIAGPHIFVSGQLPADASGNLIDGSIADKTTAVCENLKAILEDAGSSISRVVKVLLHLTLRVNGSQLSILWRS
jgi:enamine deaminase RidA (YjgF/YER057c/UK114 family)